MDLIVLAGMCRTGYAYVCPGSVMRMRTPLTNCTPWSHTFLSPHAKVNVFLVTFCIQILSCFFKSIFFPSSKQVYRRSMLMKTKDLSLCQWNKSDGQTMACLFISVFACITFMDVFHFVLYVSLSHVFKFSCNCTLVTGFRPTLRQILFLPF